MNKVFILFLSFAIAYDCNAQSYSYKYIKDGNDSVKCKRITQKGANKLSATESACFSTLELYLDKYRDCVNNPNISNNNDCNFDLEKVNYNINWAKNLKIDTKDYEDESDYYTKLIRKKVKDKQVKYEIETKQADSLRIVNANKQRTNDSIISAKRKIEYEKQLQEQQQIQKEQSIKIAEDDKKRKTDLIKRYGTTTGTNLYKNDFKLGMTKDMILYVLGEPDSKPILEQTKEGVKEYWSYPGMDIYLNFLNNKLVFVRQP